MERRNIFRGKNKKNGWIYGDLIHNRGEVFIAPIGIANPFATAEDFVVDEVEVYCRRNTIYSFNQLCPP